MLQNIDSGVFSVLDRDDYLVRQTDDRLLVPADPAVMHTDLIRTVGRCHFHFSVLDLHGVRSSVDLKCTLFLQIQCLYHFPVNLYFYNACAFLARE